MNCQVFLGTESVGKFTNSDYFKELLQNVVQEKQTQMADGHKQDRWTQESYHRRH